MLQLDACSTESFLNNTHARRLKRKVMWVPIFFLLLLDIPDLCLQRRDLLYIYANSQKNPLHLTGLWSVSQSASGSGYAARDVGQLGRY